MDDMKWYEEEFIKYLANMYKHVGPEPEHKQLPYSFKRKDLVSAIDLINMGLLK